MDAKVNNFKFTHNEIFREFEVENKYFLSILDESPWELIFQDDITLVKYTKDNEEKTSLVTQKGDKPFIVEKDGYTMIIAIDCIKIAFVFNNNLKR